jgi:hypothetical protein
MPTSRSSDLDQSDGNFALDNLLWSGSQYLPRHSIETLNWQSLSTTAHILLCFRVVGFFTAGSTQRQKSGSRICDRRTGESGGDRLNICGFHYFCQTGHLALLI